MTDLLLEGIRVLDLSQYLPGPYAGQILADLGADVIKVEPPAGDPMRRLGGTHSDGLAPGYKLINAGKTVVHLDLKTDKDRAIFVRLVERADVLVESFRPGTLDKLGFPRLPPGGIEPGADPCGDFRLGAGRSISSACRSRPELYGSGRRSGGFGRQRNAGDELSASSGSLGCPTSRGRCVGRVVSPESYRAGCLSRHQPDGNRARLAIMAVDQGAPRTASPPFGRPADRRGGVLPDLPHSGRSLRQPGFDRREILGDLLHDHRPARLDRPPVRAAAPDGPDRRSRGNAGSAST